MPVSMLQGGQTGPIQRKTMVALTPASHQFTHLQPQNGQTHTSVKTHTGTSFKTPLLDVYPRTHTRCACGALNFRDVLWIFSSTTLWTLCLFLAGRGKKNPLFLKPGSWHKSSLGSLHATGSCHPENSCIAAIRFQPLNAECVCVCMCVGVCVKGARGAVVGSYWSFFHLLGKLYRTLKCFCWPNTSEVSAASVSPSIKCIVAHFAWKREVLRQIVCVTVCPEDVTGMSVKIKSYLTLYVFFWSSKLQS